MMLHLLEKWAKKSIAKTALRSIKSLLFIFNILHKWKTRVIIFFPIAHQSRTYTIWVPILHIQQNSHFRKKQKSDRS